MLEKYSDVHPYNLVNPPADLRKLIIALESVIRYQVDYYPKDIFKDQTVARHTGRLVTLWWGMDLPDGCNKEEGERMLWVHDIPEIDIGDLLVVEAAQNLELARSKEEEESEAASKLLSESDYQLLQRFNKAADFWKGKEYDGQDLTAIAAKLIDIIDGNVVYHEVISDYCRKNGAGDLDRKMDASFNYAFSQARTMKEQLSSLPGSIRGWFESLINLQFEYISQFWKGIPMTDIPLALQHEFLLYSQKG